MMPVSERKEEKHPESKSQLGVTQEGPRKEVSGKNVLNASFNIGPNAFRQLDSGHFHWDKKVAVPDKEKAVLKADFQVSFRCCSCSVQFSSVLFLDVSRETCVLTSLSTNTVL